MSTSDNSILGLKMPTDPRWADLAAISLQEVLTDHAFCELKAATQCISLIQRYADKDGLVTALAPVVTEEWGHFRIVCAELKKRGYSLAASERTEYVNLLLQHEPKDVPGTHRLLHKLMICALIEARSCERFRLLSERLEEASLRTFYHKFMVSEAGHYRLFIDLAETYYAVQEVRAAWAQWLAIEERVLHLQTPRGDRLH